MTMSQSFKFLDSFQTQKSKDLEFRKKCFSHIKLIIHCTLSGKVKFSSKGNLQGKI